VPRLSLFQLLVYGSLAVAILLVGARWLRSSEQPAANAGGRAWSFAADETKEKQATYGDVVVHVAGAVGKPGVYRLPAGSRVVDALERAGGASGAASPDGINLAARLTDGQQVVVPSRSTARSAGIAGGGPVSVGTATEAQLDEIEGIGPVTARRIIEFRQRNGGIATVEQLDRIEGIGPATMRALRSSLQP